MLGGSGTAVCMGSWSTWRSRQPEAEMKTEGPQPLWAKACTQMSFPRSKRAVQTFDCRKL